MSSWPSRLPHGKRTGVRHRLIRFGRRRCDAVEHHHCAGLAPTMTRRAVADPVSPLLRVGASAVLVEVSKFPAISKTARATHVHVYRFCRSRFGPADSFQLITRKYDSGRSGAGFAAGDDPRAPATSSAQSDVPSALSTRITLHANAFARACFRRRCNPLSVKTDSRSDHLRPPQPPIPCIFGSSRMRLMTARCKARLACRSPPRLRRWRWVMPDEAGSGATPQSIANAASDFIRSELSPAVTSIFSGDFDTDPDALE